jgi:methylenetetrahydrofolate dehydrogenase (NADP+)/methenyltetrahydrofolate cyclohydrolase
VPARLLSGTDLAATLRAELADEIAAFTRRAGRPPGLGIVLAGDDPASEIYVRNKIRTATEAGLRVDLERVPATGSLADVLQVVDRLNRSDAHDGILVQSPLPAAMGKHAEQQVFDAVDPAKDVDGFNPINVGRLAQNRTTLAPCTPLGVIAILERNHLPIAGQHAVIIGRSDIVGKPMALLLLQRHATVTICHSQTRDLARYTTEGDILVAATGRAGLVTPAHVKPGATVIDVGINRLTDRADVEKLYAPGTKRWEDFQKRGSLVVGDVHPGVVDVAGALTPVPGGIGPLTIAMLMGNVLRAAQNRAEARGR